MSEHEGFHEDMGQDAFSAAMDDFLERFMYISVGAMMAGHRRVNPAVFHRENAHISDAFMRDLGEFFHGNGAHVLQAVDGILRRANNMFHSGDISVTPVSEEEFKRRVNDPTETRDGYFPFGGRAFYSDDEGPLEL